MCNTVTKKQTCSNVDLEYCKMEEDFDNLMHTIDAFKGLVYKPINRKDLEDFPLMVWVNIGEGISIRKRKNRFNNMLNFDTEMQEGAEFGEHFHNDTIESCEVVKGLLFDRITKKHYKEGDVAHYEQGEKHEPIAMDYTFLHVLFK